MIYIISDDASDDLVMPQDIVNLRVLNGWQEFEDNYKNSLKNRDVRSTHLEYFKNWIDYINDSNIFLDLGIKISFKYMSTVKDDMNFLTRCLVLIDAYIEHMYNVNPDNEDIIVFTTKVDNHIISEVQDYVEILKNLPREFRPRTGGGGVERHPIFGIQYVIRCDKFLIGSHHTLIQYLKVTTLAAALTNIPLVNSYSVRHPKNIFECIENYLGIQNAYTD
jgi:hypothetical protein